MKTMHKLLFLGLLASIAVTAQAENPDVRFTDLLSESGMLYESPAGFSEVEQGGGISFQSEKRIISDDGQVEIYYQLRPLGRLKVDYEDPHNSAPHPNDLFEMLFRSVAQSLASGGIFNYRAYAVEQAQKLFNAGWAAFAIFDLHPSLSADYQYGMLLAIHRNDAADAYTLFLTKDLETSKQQIQDAMTSLRFDPDAELVRLNQANPHQPEERVIQLK
jgi:hypothetical protein